MAEDRLCDRNVRELLDAAASDAPAPGGGGIAALTAASAAALLEKVANLTIGKKGYEDVQEDMKDIRQRCSHIREECLVGMDDDARAFNSVIAALHMPKDAPDRSKKVQQAFKDAAQAPFALGERICMLLQLSRDAVCIGNKWVITDAVVSAVHARAAVRSAFYNVKINLSSVTDDRFVRTMEQAMAVLEKEAEKMEKETLQLYKTR